MNNMEKIFLQIRRLNSESSQILSELNSENLSLEKLKKSMDARQDSVDELGDLTNGIRINQLSKEDADILNSLFVTFRDLNLKILRGLDEIMSNRRKEIASIAKQQKVVKSYQVSEQPDISYFKQK